MSNPFDQFGAELQAALPPAGAPPPSYEAPSFGGQSAPMNQPPMNMYGQDYSYGAPTAQDNPYGMPGQDMSNPYGAPPPPPQSKEMNPYGAQEMSNPYGAPDNSNPYGMPSQDNNANPYGAPPQDNNSNPYGAPPNDNSNPYGAPPPQDNNPYGAPPPPPPPSQENNPYGAPPPDNNPYGAPPPDNNPYGAPTPDNNPYGAPPQDNNPYGSAQDNNPYGPPATESSLYGAPPQDGSVYSAPSQQQPPPPPTSSADPFASYGAPPPQPQSQQFPTQPEVDPWGATQPPPPEQQQPPQPPQQQQPPPPQQQFSQDGGGAIVPSQQQSNPYAMPQHQNPYGAPPANPYEQQAIVPSQQQPNPYGGYGQPPAQPAFGYGAPPPPQQQQLAVVDPFSVFESKQAPPAPAPAAPAAPAPPAGPDITASDDDFFGSFSANAPPAEEEKPAPVPEKKPEKEEEEKKGEEGLPPGGEWYDARIFTPTLGVMFFKPQELTDSLFLHTDREIVDALADRPVVAFIVEGSSARSAGVELGHVLLKVNGVDVKNPKEASRLIKEGPRPLPLLFYVPNTEVVTAEGEHMVKYDTRETTAPNSAKDWKPKYVVIGGIIAQPWMMNMYRSKSEYDIAVIETQARRPVSVKVKQFSLQGARIQNDWQGPQMVKYKNKLHPWKFIVVLPVARNPIKISSPNLSQLKPVHEGIRRVLLAQQRGSGRGSGGRSSGGQGNYARDDHREPQRNYNSSGAAGDQYGHHQQPQQYAQQSAYGY